MNNFFELSESKKKALSIANLHKYAERLDIVTYKKSDKTGNNINKNKQELIDEIDLHYIKNNIKKIADKEDNKKSKKMNKFKPKIVLWITDSNLNEHIKEDNFLDNKFNVKYIEEKFNIKIEYGSFIYYEPDLYLYNYDKTFILLRKIRDNYVIISRNITKNMNDSINFFSKLKDDKIKIGCIELDKKDNYIYDNFEIDKDEKLNGINFNYTYSFEDNKYYPEIELNYLGQKNIIDNNLETFKFFPKNEISLIQIIDFQKKLSNHRFSFSFKIYGPSEKFINPTSEKSNLIWEWKDNIFIEKEIVQFDENNKEFKEDSFYECYGYITMFSKLINIKNIKENCKNELSTGNFDSFYLVRDKDFFKFNKNEFNNVIKELGCDIINFELIK